MCINRILTFPVLAIAAGFLTMAATGRSVASPDPTAAAATCIEAGADIDVDEFTKCWIVKMMSDDQKACRPLHRREQGSGARRFLHERDAAVAVRAGGRKVRPTQ